MEDFKTNLLKDLRNFIIENEDCGEDKAWNAAIEQVENLVKECIIPDVIGCNNLIFGKERKDFEVTIRTHDIPRDDMLWDVNEEVAIYVKNMNRHDDFSEVIKRLNEIMEELK